MKKTIIILSTALWSSIWASTLYADELTLSRSCIKKNPLVAGVADPTLLQIYTQICDKKNKDPQQQSVYLIQAAQRFAQLDQPYKALTLINTLEQRHIQHNVLTDVKFAASSALANQAVLQMREHEARYLPVDQANSTQNLINHIRAAQVNTQAAPVHKAPVAAAPSKPNTHRRQVARSKPSVKPIAATPKVVRTVVSASADPFNNLK